jgi:glycerol-3-phosphate dehydrogenase (NAD(P)+)
MSGVRHVAVAGAGAFGTALAVVALRAGRQVSLWGRNAAQVEAMRASRSNAAYLPGVNLPAELQLSDDPAVFRDADLVLLVTPAQTTRRVAGALADEIRSGIPVVACAKGIEQGTGRLQTDILAECLPQAQPAALSGPGFAEEIAAGLPTAVTVAATDISVAHALSAALASDSFRPYATDDLVGVEVGGAVKNVLAIACGVVAGRALGESARAALISRGLAEMTRLGLALGARAETFMGLAGVGDLVLTATSAHSRNTAFGMALGRGASPAELMAKGTPLAEGAHTARIAADLATRNGVETPIVAAVADIVEGRLGVDEAIERLVRRPLKAERG